MTKYNNQEKEQLKRKKLALALLLSAAAIQVAIKAGSRRKVRTEKRDPLRIQSNQLLEQMLLSSTRKKNGRRVLE